MYTENIRFGTRNSTFLWGDARGAKDSDAGIAVADGVSDGDLEARRRRLHRDRGGSVVARREARHTTRPVVVPRDERRADGAVRSDLLDAHLPPHPAPE